MKPLRTKLAMVARALRGETPEATEAASAGSVGHPVQANEFRKAPAPAKRHTVRLPPRLPRNG